MSESSNLPDPAMDRTPESTAQIKNFKAQLLMKGTAKSTSLLVTNAVPTNNVINIPDDETNEDNLDSLPDSFDEEVPATEEYTEEAQQLYTTALKVENPAPALRDPIQAISLYLESTPAREEIKIIGSFGKIGFKAINVSINDYGIAIIIKKDALQFEPNLSTELKVAYRGVEYDVIYAGGFFTFPKIPFTFISFLRVTEAKS